MTARPPPFAFCLALLTAFAPHHQQNKKLEQHKQSVTVKDIIVACLSNLVFLNARFQPCLAGCSSLVGYWTGAVNSGPTCLFLPPDNKNNTGSAFCLYQPVLLAPCALVIFDCLNRLSHLCIDCFYWTNLLSFVNFQRRVYKHRPPWKTTTELRRSERVRQSAYILQLILISSATERVIESDLFF